MAKLDEYQNDAIRVTYDSEICTHAARCVRGLPKVFDANATPWIQVQNAEPGMIVEQVKRCPSGALQYQLLSKKE